MAEISHLSYSSVSAYQLCARAWEFRYVKKVQVPASPGLIFGSAFHGTVERIIKSRVAGETQTPIEGLWAENWAKVQEQEIDWAGELPEELHNLGLRMLTHKDTVATLQNIEPQVDSEGAAVIEKRVELRVPGVPVPIIGYLDILLADGSIADLKTAARAWPPGKADGEMQPLFYLAALNQAGYTQNPAMAFRHYVFVKTKTPQVQTLSSQHTPAQLFWLFGAIKETWRGIDAGVFPPNPGSWLCSSKWCSYWDRCRGRK